MTDQPTLNSRHRAARNVLVGLGSVLFSLVFWPCASIAQLTDAFVTTGSKGRDVLAVTTQCSPTGSGGLGKASVTIASTTGPSQSERRLQVALYIRSYGDSAPVGRVVRRSVTLPEGQVFVEVDIPFVSENQFSYDVEVFEGRRNIENKTRQRTRSRNATEFNIVNSNVFYSRAAIILATRTEANQLQVSGELQRMELLLWGSAANQPLSCVAQEDMSSDWRSLLEYDFVMLPAPLLDRLINRAPGKSQALEDYVSAGGRVVIYSEAGVDSEEVLSKWIPEQSSRLQWSHMNAPAESWWNRNHLQVDNVNSSAAANSNGGFQLAPQYAGNGPIQVRLPDGRIVTVSSVQQANNLLQTRPGSQIINLAGTVGGGHVQTPSNVKRPEVKDESLQLRGVAYDAAVAAESGLAWKGLSAVRFFDDTWRLLEESAEISSSYSSGAVIESKLGEVRSRLFQTLSDSPVRLAHLHAGDVVLMNASPLSANVNFDLSLRPLLTRGVRSEVASEVDGDWGFRNIIRAVGKPPVWTFCFAVALFGALLGPGLLFFTARMSRRSLMLLFVPVVSLFATVSIITYGVFHEGFGTYLRTVSVQWVDSETQEGFTWSRQNYFAGAPDRRGLVFEADTYVREVHMPGSENSYTIDPREDVGVDLFLDGDRQVWRQWLRARNQQQLMVGHRISGVRLPVAVEQAGEGLVRFTNLSQQTVKLAVVRDASDLHYVCHDLAPGAAEVVEGGDKAAVMSQTARLWADIRPTPPPELRVGGGSLLQFGRNRFSIGNSGSDVLNNTFKQYFSDQAELPLGTVAAVVGHTDCLELPVQGETEESIHLIIGANAW